MVSEVSLSLLDYFNAIPELSWPPTVMTLESLHTGHCSAAGEINLQIFIFLNITVSIAIFTDDQSSFLFLAPSINL